MTTVRRIRGGSGLGDSLYVRPVAEYFVKRGDRTVVLSNYPGVFLGSGAEVEPFVRNHWNVLAHYTAGKYDPATNQWQDVCRSARVGSLPLKFEWRVRSMNLITQLRAATGGRPLVLLHGGRIPMGRRDGFGMEILPRREAFCAVLAELEKTCYVVRVGMDNDQVYSLPANRTLNGSTTVTDLLDVASQCDGIVAQCSFAVPLAEVFDKPLLAVWAEAGLNAAHKFVRAITPQKVLSKPTSRHVFDSWDEDRIKEVTRGAFHYA